MANDTTKKPDVKDATDKAPDDKASGQLDPTPEQTTPAPEKADPAKVVSFEQVKTAAKEAPAPAADQPEKDAALQKEQEAFWLKWTQKQL